jgi:hypothetical protein
MVGDTVKSCQHHFPTTPPCAKDCFGEPTVASGGAKTLEKRLFGQAHAAKEAGEPRIGSQIVKLRVKAQCS